MHAALVQLESHAAGERAHGSIHAAAWVLARRQGRRSSVRARRRGPHNALDKVIGALVRSEADMTKGYALITSRASFEMVQKAATAGISFVAAVSAPTALAIRMAEQTGLTLVGFARRHSHVVYANPDRLSEVPVLMKIEALIKMANQIADFFQGEAGRCAAAVAMHLRRYWEPRMRKDMLLTTTSMAAKASMRLPEGGCHSRREGVRRA
jgi:hypothetical protein